MLLNRVDVVDEVELSDRVGTDDHLGGGDGRHGVEALAAARVLQHQQVLPLPVLQGRRRFAAREDAHERLAELLVHEAVGDGVAAGRHVGQEVEQSLGQRRHVLVGRLEVEDHPGLDDVDGGPAQEELQHHHEQHANDADLVLADLPRIAVADAVVLVAAGAASLARRGAVGGGPGRGVVEGACSGRQAAAGRRHRSGHHRAGPRQARLLRGRHRGDAAHGVPSQQPQLDGSVVGQDALRSHACNTAIGSECHVLTTSALCGSVGHGQGDYPSLQNRHWK